MTTLLILATPCIALMAPILSPAIGVLVVLALAVALRILMTILILQTWNVGDGDEVEDEAEAEAVVEDATNIVYAAFAALARSPGATSTSFRVASGMVVPQHSTADDREDANGYANGIWSEEVGLGDKNNSGTDGRELSFWPEPFHPWGKQSTPSYSSSRKRYGPFQRLGGFRISGRSREGADMVSQMV